MSVVVLIAALMAAPGSKCAQSECAAVVNAAVVAGKRFKIDPVVLVAVALAESGADPQAVGRLRGNRCDLGAFQIHVGAHRPKMHHALASVEGLPAGAMAAGYLLDRSRRLCRRRRDCPCQWAFYNWGRPRRWCASFRRAMRHLGGKPCA